MNGEPKVVSFEQWSKDSAKPRSNHVFVQGRSIFLDGVAERMSRFFAMADDELFRLSEKADNSVQQGDYFDNMRYLRRQKEELQQHYLQQLTSFYEAFWRGRPGPAPSLRQASRVSGELTLLRDEALEESLAINGMVEKGDALFRQELCALGQRFMMLRGRPGEAIGINPVSPWVLCRFFGSEIQGLNLELDVKLLLCKLFDTQVLSAFGPVYQALNAMMAKEGILPALPQSQQKKQNAKPLPQKNEQNSVTTRADALNAMREFLEAWHRGVGMPAQKIGYGLKMAGSGEILTALSLLQQSSRKLAAESGVLSSRQMKWLITKQIASLRADGKAPLLERQAEETIDMVGMVFVSLLEDLPSSVRHLLASLQIPIVKIAILEKAFFEKKNHPARLLLNRLTQAGMDLRAEFDIDSPVYQKIESVVKRILSEQSSNARMFYELLEDFTAFMAIEHRRNRAAEELTPQVTQSKEQVRQAKKRVAYVIALRLHVVNAPLVLKAFLYNVWKDVLVLAWLSNDKDQENWNSAISLMDQVIGVMTCASDSIALRQHRSGGRSLLEAMEERLKNLACEQHWVMELFRELETYHDERLQGSRFQADPRSPQRFLVDALIKDAEFAELLKEIESALRVGTGGRETDTKRGRKVDDFVCGSVSPVLENIKEDEFVSKARSLTIGQWLESTEYPNKPQQVKLSWKNKESSAYVFVNAKGVKVAEMQLADLANSLKAGKLSVIDEPRAPLMDWAFSWLLGSLESPAHPYVP